MDEMIMREYESSMIWTLLIVLSLYFGYRIWSSWRAGNEYKKDIESLTNKLSTNPKDILES